MSESPESPPELAIAFDKHPLVPAVIVDSSTGAVLMIGFMNEEAYRKTRETGRTHFWSRSRQALWKKGETSGHEQFVERMAINCEENSLLIEVRQIGAVCHEGYASCFFRDIEEDETVTVTMERHFDPDAVYGGGGVDPVALWFGAYRYLRDEPLEGVSGTSRILHSRDPSVAGRVADELEELAGVLDGTHVHATPDQDAVLEGSQSLYWLVVAALLAGLDWTDVRPDRALTTTIDTLESSTIARLLRSEAASWRDGTRSIAPERVHAAISIVAQAAVSAGTSPAELIAHDLTDLRKKSYLGPYFERSQAR
jgi:phosphoribosyl-AMP cyclohydrolase